MRIQFDADEPVSLWTRAYAGGKRIEQGYKSNASAKWSGSGYALGWISFDAPVEVDEIRIVAGGGKPYREREVATLPVKLRWGDGPAAAATAAWVPELSAATAAAWEAERRAAEANRGIGDTALGLVLMPPFLALVLACVGAPIWALWKWRGWWRARGRCCRSRSWRSSSGASSSTPHAIRPRTTSGRSRFSTPARPDSP